MNEYVVEETFVFCGERCYVGARIKCRGAKIRRGEIVKMGDFDLEKHRMYLKGMFGQQGEPDPQWPDDEPEDIVASPSSADDEEE